MMKAAVFYGPRDVKVEEVEKPKIQDNEILINVKACGICGSDLHMYKLNLFTPLLCRPLKKGGIPGHEYSGEIVEVGSKVKGFKEGERVVALSNGGMAEYIPVTIVDGFNIIKIPPGVSYEEAATLEPIANSYHAMNKCEIPKGANIVIFGAGTIGLGIIQCLKALDVDLNKIIVVDLSDHRLNLAKKLGANAVINAKETDPQKKIMELVGVDPLSRLSIIQTPKVDIVYDCVGYMKQHKGPLVLQQAISIVRELTGTIVIHGIFEDTISLDMLFMIGKEVTVKGSFAFTREELEKSLELIRNKKIDRSLIISHEFPLDNAKEAFETQCNTSESVKVLIKP